MKYPKLPVLIFVSLLVCVNIGYSFNTLSDSIIVARYDKDRIVTITQLNKYIEDWLYFRKFKKREDIYRNALNDLLINQFKRMDFFEKGIDKDTKLLQDLNRIINEEIVANYFETQYMSKYVNIDYARNIYKIMDRTVFYKQIVLNKPKNASKKQLDSLKEKALLIKTKLEKGGNYKELDKKYSDNKNSMTKNDELPPVDWKQYISDPVAEAIFNLKKNDIRVINSEKEIIIVKVTDVKKIHLEPFDSIKDKILSDLRGGFEETCLNEYDKDKANLINENSLIWNENALNQISKWSETKSFFMNEYKKTINDAIESGDNKKILTYDKGAIDYKDFLRLLMDVLTIKNSEVLKEEEIKKFILEAVRTDLIVKKAEELGLKKNVLNAFTENPAIKNKIGQIYNQFEIENKIPQPNEEDLKKYFKENEDGLYYQLSKVNLFVLKFSNKEEAEKVLSKINSGTPFEKVTGSYLVKTYIKERNGEVKTLESNDKPVFAKVAFTMKESEITGPIEFKDENGKTNYAILKCYKSRPEKQLTFEDVKNTIADDYKEYCRKNISKEVAERLKNKYQPKINEEVLEKLISTKK